MTLVIPFQTKLTTLGGHFFPSLELTITSRFRSGEKLFGFDLIWPICTRSEYPTINSDDAQVIGLGLTQDNIGEFNVPIPWLGKNAVGKWERLRYSLPGYQDRYWTCACLVTPFLASGALMFPMRELLRHFDIVGATNSSITLDTKKPLKPGDPYGLASRFPKDVDF